MPEDVLCLLERRKRQTRRCGASRVTVGAVSIALPHLLTTVTEGYDRPISMHGVRREFESSSGRPNQLGLPLHEVLIPPQCVNPATYEARMSEALAGTSRARRAATWRSTGDIFLGGSARLSREKSRAAWDDSDVPHLEARHSRTRGSFSAAGLPRDCRVRRSPRSRSVVRGARA